MDARRAIAPSSRHCESVFGLGVPRAKGVKTPTRQLPLGTYIRKTEAAHSRAGLVSDLNPCNAFTVQPH